MKLATSMATATLFSLSTHAVEFMHIEQGSDPVRVGLSSQTASFNRDLDARHDNAETSDNYNGQLITLNARYRTEMGYAALTSTSTDVDGSDSYISNGFEVGRVYKLEDGLGLAASVGGVLHTDENVRDGAVFQFAVGREMGNWAGEVSMAYEKLAPSDVMRSGVNRGIELIGKYAVLPNASIYGFTTFEASYNNRIKGAELEQDYNQWMVGLAAGADITDNVDILLTLSRTKSRTEIFDTRINAHLTPAEVLAGGRENRLHSAEDVIGNNFVLSVGAVF